MEFSTIAIVLAGFTAAWVNAVFATGGVYIIIAACSLFLPLAVTVPLQPALAYASLLARVRYFWPHIQWPIVAAFTAGSLAGVYLGTRLFVQFSEFTLSLLLGLMMLLLVWLPPLRWRIPVRHPFFLIGALHSFISTLCSGASIMQTVILRTPLLKLQLTSTLASCFLAMETLRIIGYAAHGFDYGRYLTLIGLGSLAGVAGTWAGKRSTHRVSEKSFRLVFKSLMTLVGLRLLYRAFLLY